MSTGIENKSGSAVLVSMMLDKEVKSEIKKLAVRKKRTMTRTINDILKSHLENADNLGQ